MSRKGTKTLTLTTATGVTTWSIQQIASGNTTTGIIGLLLGLALFGGYQLAEETSHSQAYAELVEKIGEDTLTELAETGADELRDYRNRDANEPSPEREG